MFREKKGLRSQQENAGENLQLFILQKHDAACLTFMSHSANPGAASYVNLPDALTT